VPETVNDSVPNCTVDPERMVYFDTTRLSGGLNTAAVKVVERFSDVFVTVTVVFGTGSILTFWP